MGMCSVVEVHSYLAFSVVSAVLVNVSNVGSFSFFRYLFFHSGVGSLVL